MGILIYTDGGCSGNPGPGAWAYVILEDKSAKIITEKWGSQMNTTNNRMELSAVIAALEALAGLDEGHGNVTVYTDSQYVQKGIQTWIHAWKRNGWKTSDKKPVKNIDLWQKLDDVSSAFLLTWKWVKGHAGNEFNERCDRMTQEAIASLTGGLF
ncbi:MAG: ribonuclease HI [Spirochaetaceae bacterium]|jgi:ribonuclease HI|nr:ribonuclease HI [Spirochaetaceae bacterium]